MHLLDYLYYTALLAVVSLVWFTVGITSFKLKLRFVPLVKNFWNGLKPKDKVWMRNFEILTGPTDLILAPFLLWGWIVVKIYAFLKGKLLTEEEQ